MGRLIQLDFGRKHPDDECLGNDITVCSGEPEENTDGDADNDLLMINIGLTGRIKNSFRFLANFEKRLVEELVEHNIGQYIGWDCNQEYVSFFVSGGNAAVLGAQVVCVLRNLELNAEHIEILSYLQGEIPF